ncbi:MAG: hypothetical protein OXI25_01155 [Chloroflexota bacterium]|nr:hypothetical protein [Chloroflexota bacterium]
MTNVDPRYLSFSQAQGYESLPHLLQLEEISEQARVALWNVLYEEAQVERTLNRTGGFVRSYTMNPILRSIYSEFLMQPLDEWRSGYNTMISILRPFIMSQPFNRVFDLLTFIMRHPQTPRSLVGLMAAAFREHQLAYRVDTTPPPTIYPISTPEEGEAVATALDQIRQAGHGAAGEHLRKAVDCINGQDWPGAVRESIHAVESVARQIAPEAKTLGDALQALKKKGLLKHPALHQALSSLYGYTSDEQGIRHALLDRSTADVGQDEALFMFGACASFASYLSRKQIAISE